jgi:predicted glutamine amidotransferase
MAMCGLGGYAGIKSEKARESLVWTLGMGIDQRGGHAAGFVSVGETIRCHKKLGSWLGAKNKFIRAAASGEMCMMHARFATCGKKTVDEAHPFAIQREGRTRLYGAHNGIVYNADESAKKHGRSISVDSEEIFECIADGNIAGLRKLEGYGVITWIDPATPGHVNLVRLSRNADIFVCHVAEGGIVWGSTKTIVRDALQLAGLTETTHYKLEAVGQVWQLRSDGMFKSELGDGYKFAESTWRSKWGRGSYGGFHSNYSSYGDILDDLDEDDAKLGGKSDWDRWNKEWDEREKTRKEEKEVEEAWDAAYKAAETDADELDETEYLAAMSRDMRM